MTKQRTLLVTGHLGYLGVHVSREARDAGWTVRGMDSALFAANGDGAPADIRDAERADLENVEAVVHLAGLSSDSLSDLVPETCRQVNQLAAVRLAELARSAGVRRFVFASTLGIFGNTEETWCEESTPPAPATVYRETKAAAEREILALASDSFQPQVLRLPTLYGDSPRLRLDLVVNLFTHRALQGAPLRVDAEGRPWRPLVHVSDAARAFVLLAGAHQPCDVPPAINLCDEAHNHRLAEVAQTVAARVPGTLLNWSRDELALPGSYRARSQVLSTALPGFTFRHRLADGIDELVARLERAPLPPAELARSVRTDWVRAGIQSGRFTEALR